LHDTRHCSDHTRHVQTYHTQTFQTSPLRLRRWPIPSTSTVTCIQGFVPDRVLGITLRYLHVDLCMYFVAAPLLSISRDASFWNSRPRLFCCDLEQSAASRLMVRVFAFSIILRTIFSTLFFVKTRPRTTLASQLLARWSPHDMHTSHVSALDLHPLCCLTCPPVTVGHATSQCDKGALSGLHVPSLPSLAPNDGDLQGLHSGSPSAQ